MKYTFLFLALFSILACKPEASKTMVVQNPIPACLQQTIADHQSNYPTPFETPATLKHYRYNGKDAYLFDPDPAHSHLRDWMYKVVDADCNQVCSFGGGFANLPNTCADFEATAEKVAVIWVHE